MPITELTQPIIAYVKPVIPIDTDIIFVDYTGEILYGWDLSELQSKTELPPLPTHTGLTCNGWNWTLQELKAHNATMVVGAVYTPTDGKTHIKVVVEPDDATYTAEINFAQSVANGVTVDWGDGSPTETKSTTTSGVISHTYTNAGTYDITLNVTSGTVTFAYAMTTNRRTAGKIRGFHLGNNVSVVNPTAFAYLYKLDYLTLSPTIASLVVGTQNCSVKTLIIPRIESTVSLSLTNVPVEILSFAGITKSSSSLNVVMLKRVDAPSTYTGAITATNPTCSAAVLCKGTGNLATNNFVYKLTVAEGVTGFNFNLSNALSVKTLRIPSTVTSITSLANTTDNNLTSLYLCPTTPPTASDTTFTTLNTNCIIYVPTGCISAYSSATNYPDPAVYTYREFTP